MQSLYSVGPDLLVVACFYLVVAMLLRPATRGEVGTVRANRRGSWHFVLGENRHVPARPGGSGRAYSDTAIHSGMGALIFWCVCAHLIFMLSVHKGRFTFADSGRGNYAWFVAPRTSPRN